MSKKLISLLLSGAVLSSVGFAVYANEYNDQDFSDSEESEEFNVEESIDHSPTIEDEVNEEEEGLLEQPYDLSEVDSQNPSLDRFELAAENDALSLYVEESTLAIKIVNNETGFIWSSTLDDIEEENLNETWQKFVQSAVSVDFINQRDQERTEYVMDDDTDIDIRYEENGISASIVFPSEIAMEFSIELLEDSFEVSIPEEGIVEHEDALLTSLSLYPFLGATKQNEVAGYQFIPDGSGALIRYDDESARMDFPYRARIYGEDQGITTGHSLTNSQAPHILSMPVFGFVHGVDQNALFSIIETGEEYSELVAYKAGLSTEFNWLTAEFIYRSAYRQPTNRSGTQAIDGIQQEKNSFDIQMRYALLENEDANYVGMAKNYQNYLIENDMLNPEQSSNPPIRLEFLGGEREEGLFWDRYVTMTSVEEMTEHIHNLNAAGLDEAKIVYKGWYDGGFTGGLPNRFPLDRRLGSQNDVLDMQESLNDLGFNIHFQTDYTRAYNRPTRIDTNEFVEQISTRDISFTQGDTTTYSYMLPEGSREILNQDLEQYEDYGMNSLALKNTPKALFSTFNRNNRHDRGANRELTVELIEELQSFTDNRLAMYEPHVYLWNKAESYLDIPMDNSRFIYMTDSVPFIHIVLKGHLDYYSPFANFVPNQRENLLRTVEYGAYPSFYLTTENPFALIDTDSSNLYTSQMENWQEAVLEQYEEVKEVHEATRNATIDNREIVEEGLINVTYSNGVHVLVNYTDTMLDTEYGSVEGQSFIISRGGE